MRSPVVGGARTALAALPLELFTTAFLFRAAQNAALTTLGPIGDSDLHLGAGAVGAVSALGSAVGVVATVVLGRWLSTAGVRRWMGVGLALTAVGLVMLGLANGIATFVAAAIVLGLGGGLVLPSLTTLVGGGGGRSASRPLSALTVVLSISLATGPLVESALIRAGGGSLRIPLMVFAALPAAAAILVFLRTPRVGAAIAPVGRTGDELGVPDVSASPAIAGASLRPGTARSPWRRPGWRLATSGQLLYQLPFAAVVVFGVLVARHVYLLSASSAQLGLTAFFATSMVTRLWLTWHGKVTRARRTLLLSAGLTIVGVAVLSSGVGEVAYFVGLIALGFPHGLTYPIGLSLIAEETPRSHLAHANASFSAWTTGVNVVLPALLGGIAAVLGLRAMLALILIPVLAMTALIASGTDPDSGRPRVGDHHHPSPGLAPSR
ncbi:MAG: MFS transporter [Acidimicrobiales bacterium]